MMFIKKFLINKTIYISIIAKFHHVVDVFFSYICFIELVGMKKEQDVKTPFQAVKKRFILKPEILKKNPCNFKKKLLSLQ